MFKKLLIGIKNHNKRKSMLDNIQAGHYLADTIYDFENSDFTKAAKRFELIAQAIPEHPIAHLFLGRTLIELGEYTRAIDSLFCHLNISPNSVEAMIYLGLSYYECGEINLAEDKFEQALKIRRGSLLARENLAIARIASGDLDDALEDLRSLHRQSPSDPNILELLIITLGRLGFWDEAKVFTAELGVLKSCI